MAKYDLIILGTGPAGYAAAIYAVRFKLKMLLIGKELGGLANEAPLVENYAGFRQIKGMGLMDKFKEHSESLGAKIIEADIKEVFKKNNLFQVITGRNKSYEAKSLIIALGAKPRKLELPEEAGYEGKGISYCGTCDAPLFKDKIVGILGGANSAVKTAILLAEYAKKVYLIYRKNELNAEPINISRIKEDKKIILMPGTNIIKIIGDDFIKSVMLDNGRELMLDGLFVQIGYIPSTDVLKKMDVGIDASGCIKVNKDMSTNIPGCFAAGDITDGSNKFRQIITAAAEGSIAANSTYAYLKNKKHKGQKA